MSPRATLVALVAMVATTGPARPDEPKVHDLIRELVAAEPEARTKAAEALLSIGPPAIEPLLKVAASRNEVLAAPARELLPRFGPSSVDTFIRLHNMPRNRENKGHFHEATRAVAAMGRVVIPQMTEMLIRGSTLGSDPGFATFTLSKMDGPAVDALVPLLKHENTSARVRASTILAGIADPRSLDALVASLRSDADDHVRLMCARGLGLIGDHRAAAPLLAALRDPDWGVRGDAAASLGRIWEQRFRGPVARVAREDPRVATRDNAAYVLIHSSRDPVAIRLGWRYRPPTVEPLDQSTVEGGYVAVLILTGFVLLAGVSVAAVAGGPAGVMKWVPIAISLLVAVAAGYWWGWTVERITGWVENALLVVVVPGWAAVVLVAGRFVLAPRKQLVFRGACAAAVLGFYASYGVGWLRLWGHL